MSAPVPEVLPGDDPSLFNLMDDMPGLKVTTTSVPALVEHVDDEVSLR